MSRPILAVDVDGVISPVRLRGAAGQEPSARFELVDGMVHCISLRAGERLLRLAEHYDLVWATGWEDKANYYLPQMLGLPELPHLTFDGAARFGSAHWKLGPLDDYCARPGRWPGSTTTSTRAATSGRGSASEPTLLVPTESAPRARGGRNRSADRLGARPRSESRRVTG